MKKIVFLCLLVSATLTASNNINLTSAQDTFDNSTNSTSSSSSAGVSAMVGSNGIAIGVTASGSAGKGKANETTVTNQNTHINANDTITIKSNNDTNIKGAVVAANTVNADIGNNLNIESLQDTSTYKSSSQNIGGSVTVGYGASASASYAQSNAKSDYQSVNEQSGIKAKDGGFNIKVANNTDLKGAVIESSDKAIDNNKNSLTTATITTSDINNKAEYSASSMSIGISGGGGSMMGMGGYSDDKGDASSTTKSAISKSNINITNEDKQKALTGKDTKETIASINTDTKNSHTKLEKIFNKEEVEAKVQASAEIIKTFSSVAPKAIGDYSDSKKKELTAQAEQAQKENNTVKQQELLAEAKKWDEGGIYRVALHTVAGGMGGGLAGATANATVASSAPILNELQAKTAESLIKSGMNETAAKAIASIVSTGVASGIGAIAGGATNGSSGAITGAIGGGTTDMNNRQLHEDEKEKLANLKKNKTKAEKDKLDAASCYLTHCEAEYAIGSAQYNKEKAKYDLGATLATEQNILRATGLFTYSTVDIINPDGFIVKGNKSDKSSDADARKQKTQGIIYTQQKQTAVADAAAFISKTAGQYSAASTTYATYLNSSPIAQSKTAAGIMYGQALLATEIGFGASMVEQAFRPNVKQAYIEGGIDLATYFVGGKYPILSFPVNEAGNLLKDLSK